MKCERCKREQGYIRLITQVWVCRKCGHLTKVEKPKGGSKMKELIIAVMLVMVAGTAQAEQRYNAFENCWETVPDNSNWTPQYNAFDNDWSYQPSDADMEYNAFENSWDWDSGHGNEY